MDKVELLSPAGSYESAIAAIQNGCDAIYMGGSKFGARAYASNFNEQQLQDMISYAHAYGVKVYITINTLIHDTKFQECIQYIQFLYTIGCDAIIVQDLGILSYIRENYSDFEVHASTQMHIQNKQALRFLIQQQVVRAVLARESTLEEIAQYAKEDIELEVFVHGALCVAYSGQCLFSSMVGDRSANRGECAQGCRMPYHLIDGQNKVYKKGYLLSLKDLNIVEHLPELLDCKIASLKIEGRMKKAEYVANVTSLYRKAIDAYHENKHISFSQSERLKSEVIFNRGFTKGWMFEQTGSKLFNPLRPNHMGIEIGTVIKTYKNKFAVKLHQPLSQHDGIRLLQAGEDVGCKVQRLLLNGLLVNHAPANSVIEIESSLHAKVGSVVLKTSDVQVEKEIQQFIAQSPRKVHIDMHFVASLNKPMQLMVSDGVHQVKVQGELAQQAQNRASDEAMVYKALSKVNETIFSIAHFSCEIDGHLFIVNKHLNEMRREALQKLYTLRSKHSERTHLTYEVQKHKMSKHIDCIVCKVRSEAQLLACLEANVTQIYVDDVALYSTYKDREGVYLASSKIHKGAYTEVSYIEDIGGLYQNQNFICGSGLNVYNAYTAKFLQQQGADVVCLSLELHPDAIKQCIQTYYTLTSEPVGFMKQIYGRVEVMVSKHCPIHAVLVDQDKKNCNICRNKQFYLKDKFNNTYPMLNDANCNMHLFDYKCINELHEMTRFQAMGVTHFLLDFTIESKEETLRTILNTLRTLQSNE